MGGDIHFDEDEKWTVRQHGDPKDGKHLNIVFFYNINTKATSVDTYCEQMHL